MTIPARTLTHSERGTNARHSGNREAAFFDSCFATLLNQLQGLINTVVLTVIF